MSDATAPGPAESPEPTAAAAAQQEPTPDAVEAAEHSEHVAHAEAAPVEPAQKAETAPRALAAEHRRKTRRGAIVSGAISLPLVTLGTVLLAVPLAVWYLSTVIRTLVVVVANILSGDRAADDANSTLGRIDPTALGGVTLGFAIVGAVFVVAGWLVSFFVLRAHRVDRPGYVTGFGIAVGLVVASVLSATIGALTGLILATAQTVGQVLGNATLGIALTTIGSTAVTVATGILVWVWMERLFRATDAERTSAA